MLTYARHRAIVLQGALIAAVSVGAYVLVTGTAANLSARGIPLGFGFLFAPANFSISETLLPFKPQDPNWWAIVVGIANTLFVSAVVISASSILGLLVGIGRLSGNPLVAGATRVWVEIARNTPVLILLIFVYALWWKILPTASEAANPLPGVYLSMRGLALPLVDIAWPPALVMTLITCAAAVWAARGLAVRRQEASGHRPAYVTVAVAASIATLAATAVLSGVSATVEWPRLGRTNVIGGLQLTPELTTILVGLTIYTTGFIAEIVRGGILAIGKGQWEAARSLGLTQGRILRLVVVPQTLRVVLPPLTSQYVNVVKNSTLAIAVGYQDFMTIVGTIINKTSHAVEGIAIILGIFLILNLLLSGALNWVNRRMAIVER
ncbi:ABC transporter permease subunit [Rhabdaerophilum sp. SD176]|uniref:amino acid ABC transporter permease n=1 Tax=Rhabdaerophilum sp. SD176 TaxID=2983548 RepID=UPI0024E02BCA|nr:ABC transporter permease subunit [Rhabdaerophilum sp. SD176]